jgi:hypothetical protein
LDLDPQFASLDVAGLRVLPLVSLANARAYALVGERVAGWVLERGLLPADGPR